MKTPVQAPERAFDVEHRAITLGLLALVTMFAFEAVAVSLAMPSVARELDGETLYPIAVVGLLTAAIIGMVVGGTWSDARGPGLPLSIGASGSSPACSCPASPAPWRSSSAAASCKVWVVALR